MSLIDDLLLRLEDAVDAGDPMDITRCIDFIRAAETRDGFSESQAERFCLNLEEVEQRYAEQKEIATWILATVGPLGPTLVGAGLQALLEPTTPTLWALVAFTAGLFLTSYTAGRAVILRRWLRILSRSARMINRHIGAKKSTSGASSVRVTSNVRQSHLQDDASAAPAFDDAVNREHQKR